jgi:hypothetical protein
MWQKKATNLANSFNLPNPGLRAYLNHVVEGNLEVYRPPFWKGVKPQAVLDEWHKVLDRSKVKSDYPTLYAYELEMRDKVGPMSYQLPLKDRLKDVENYYTMIQLPSVPIKPDAIQMAADYYGRAKGIRLASVENTLKEMRLDTNSGSPDFMKRSRALNDTEKMLPPTSIDIDTKYELVAVLGWRGQEGGPSIHDVKQRVVWMMPFAVNVRELQLGQPLIKAFQKHELVPAWVSNDAVDKRITRLWDSKAPEVEIICTDFSKFDQHFNKHMQSAASDILRKLVTPSQQMEDWFNTIFPLAYNIPIVCSDKITFYGDHGEGSGSGLTNANETVSHRSCQYDAALYVHDELLEDSQDLGDDGMIGSEKGKVTAKTVVEAYSRHGQEMNVEKQYVSAHDCQFLRRWHHEDYREGGLMVGVYPTFRALGRLLYQERFYDPEVWGPKMVTLRAWSILENCNHHPLFEEFVDFAMKGDKYRLGLDIPGFIEDIGRISKEATELLPDFIGYNQSNMSGKKGITEWRVCKYLKSKA